MSGTEPFYPDGWFPVATSRELGRKPLRRFLCGVPLVLFRDSTKAAVALHDRCPHRHAPLSDGRVVDGEIECPYHGWRFNSQGRCTAIPFHDGAVPQRFVAKLPVEERHGLVFVKRGDGDASIYTPYWEGEGRTLSKIIPTEAETRLIDVMENVLDPTHTAFTHNTLMRGMGDKRRKVAVSVTANGDKLELAFDGETAQDGLVSKLTGERNRTGSLTNILHPGIVEAVYWQDHRLNLVTTVYFSPAHESLTRGFIVLTTPMKAGLAYLKAAVFIPMFRMIIRQDRTVLKASHANWKTFDRPQPAVSPHDYMRPNLEALLRRQRPPVADEPLSFDLRL